MSKEDIVLSCDYEEEILPDTEFMVNFNLSKSLENFSEIKFDVDQSLELLDMLTIAFVGHINMVDGKITLDVKNAVKNSPEISAIKDLTVLVKTNEVNKNKNPWLKIEFIGSNKKLLSERKIDFNIVEPEIEVELESLSDKNTLKRGDSDTFLLKLLIKGFISKLIVTPKWKEFEETNETSVRIEYEEKKWGNDLIERFPIALVHEYSQKFHGEFWIHIQYEDEAGNIYEKESNRIKMTFEGESITWINRNVKDEFNQRQDNTPAKQAEQYEKLNKWLHKTARRR